MSNAYDDQVAGGDITHGKFNDLADHTGKRVGVGFFPQKSVTYIISKSGSTYYRTNGLTGEEDDSNADCSTLVNTTITNDLTSGGAILFKGATTYTLTAAIAPTNNISILGEGKSSFLNWSTDIHGIYIYGSAAHPNDAQGITIANLRMEGPNSGTKACIYMRRAHNNIIHNIHITGGAQGIHLSGAGPQDADNNIIYGCTIKSVLLNGIFLDGAGVVASCEENTVVSCVVEGCSESGIKSTGQRNVIVGVTIEECVEHDFDISGNYDIVSGCEAGESHKHGFYVTGNGNSLNGCTAWGNDVLNTGTYDGFYISGTDVTISGGISVGNDRHGIYAGAAAHNITGMQIRDNGQHGILATSHYAVIIGNTIHDNSQDAAGTYHGINVSGGPDYWLIANNHVYGSGANQEHGIYVGTGTANNGAILGNYCFDLMGSGIYLLENIDDCTVVGNVCINNDDYGIVVANASVNRTRVFNNTLVGNTVQIIDSGTGTMLPTVSAPFVDGSDPQDSGYEIDAGGELARSYLFLPLAVQQVLRMKVYARSVVTEADKMRAEFVIYGGVDNEAYNTNNGSVADHPSTSSNFAADDVIYWTITEAGLLTMLGGDSVEAKVLHEAAGGADCETDAFFRTVSIEYV